MPAVSAGYIFVINAELNFLRILAVSRILGTNKLRSELSCHNCHIFVEYFCLTLYLQIASVELPFALCIPISQIKQPKLRYLCTVLLIIGFPLLIPLSGLAFVVAVVLYPFCQNCNHDGFYYGTDKSLLTLTIGYIKSVNILLFLINCSC